MYAAIVYRKRNNSQIEIVFKWKKMFFCFTYIT